MSSSDLLPEKLAKIVDRFKRRSNPKQKYEQLLWYAKKLPVLPDSAKVAENKVNGCVSQVYITAELNEGKVVY